MPDVAKAQPIKQIQDYLIRRVIATSKMAVVYEVEQEKTGLAYALKLFTDDESTHADLKRFFLEAEILLKFQHPGIAKLHKTGMCRLEDCNYFFHVMELINGPPLLQYVEEKRLKVRERLELLLKICGVVQYLHQNGILHRNLRPENIMVDEATGQPMLIDLGLARLLTGSQNLTQPGQIIGNITYMSPEQAAGRSEDYDVRLDIYALGGIGYTLLAGHPPFNFKGKNIVQVFEIIRNQAPTPLSEINPLCKGEIEAIIGKALSKEKADRQATVEEFSQGLLECVKELGGGLE